MSFEENREEHNIVIGMKVSSILSIIGLAKNDFIFENEIVI